MSNPLFSENPTMKMHTVIFCLTFAVPLLCWILQLLPVTQCFSLVGVGFFILGGHTAAFFKKYLEYLEEKQIAEEWNEEKWKKILKTGIWADFGMAFFFYSLGMK